MFFWYSAGRIQSEGGNATSHKCLLRAVLVRHIVICPLLWSRKGAPFAREMEAALNIALCHPEAIWIQGVGVRERGSEKRDSRNMKRISKRCFAAIDRCFIPWKIPWKTMNRTRPSGSICLIYSTALTHALQFRCPWDKKYLRVDNHLTRMTKWMAMPGVIHQFNKL